MSRLDHADPRVGVPSARNASTLRTTVFMMRSTSERHHNEVAVKITLTQTPERVEASVVGEIDADNCKAFADPFLGAEGVATPGSDIVLDFSGLTFIDSSGVSELLRIRDAVAEGGGSLVIVEPVPAVHRVLEITGLLSMFGLS